MYLIAGGKTFRALKNLTFSPQTDLKGESVPICEFQVDVMTDERLEIGASAALYDDLDNLWASYFVSFAERQEAHTLRLRARSGISLLDTDKLAPAMYSQTPVEDVLDEVFANWGGSVGVRNYVLSEEYENATVTGYCPEQTARERLLWVVFSLGAYVEQYFSEKARINPVSEADTLIPPDVTFWKPKVSYSDYVTEVRCKFYEFLRADPVATDKYVEYDGDFYIVDEREASITDPDTPTGAPNNIVTIEGVYLINENNVSEVLSNVSRWYFHRCTIELDVINNAQYRPGERVMVYADEDTIMRAHIESCNFKFGAQARASMSLLTMGGAGEGSVDSGLLKLIYIYESVRLNWATYRLPVGYEYSIDNPYIDFQMNGHRYIFRPENARAEGVIQAEDTTQTEPMAVALDLRYSDAELHIISVDSITEEEDDGMTIGVIA